MSNGAISVPTTNISLLVFVRHHEPLQIFLDAAYRHATNVATKLKLPDGFVRPQAVMHMTMIGLEVIVDEEGQLTGAWMLRNNGRSRVVEPRTLLQIIRAFWDASGDGPLCTIRFGGFQPAWCHCSEAQRNGFMCVTSNSSHSFGRSSWEASAYSSDGPLVLTGWPVEAPKRPEVFTRWFYRFRRACEAAGFVDKYHSEVKPWNLDDDAYLRIGTLGHCPPYLADLFMEEMRTWMWRNQKLIEIWVQDLRFVLYGDPSLDSILHEVAVVEAINTPALLDDLYTRWLTSQPASAGQ